jgi:hypothetical protein
VSVVGIKIKMFTSNTNSREERKNPHVDDTTIFSFGAAFNFEIPYYATARLYSTMINKSAL